MPSGNEPFGLIIFGALWLRWFQVGAGFLWRRLNRDPMHRMGFGFLFAICGIFLQSVTEWTYRQSTIFLTFYLLLGGLASLHYARRHPVPEVAAEAPEFEEIEIEEPGMSAGTASSRR